jgi:hypothetical protein
MNLDRWLDRSKKRKRRKESVKFLSSLDGKLRIYGELLELGESEELEISDSALVVHSSVAKLLSDQRFL